MKTIALKKFMLITLIVLVAHKQLHGAMVNRAATSAAAYLRSLGQSTRRYFGFQSQAPRSILASQAALYSQGQRLTPLSINSTQAPSFANAVRTALYNEPLAGNMIPNAMVRSFSTSRASYASADEMKKFVEELLAGKKVGGSLEDTIDLWITGKMDKEMSKIQEEALSTLLMWVIRGRGNVSTDMLREAIRDATHKQTLLRDRMEKIKRVDEAIASWYAENTNSFFKMIDLRLLRSKLFARSIRSLIEENSRKAEQTIEGLEELKNGAAKVLRERGAAYDDESEDWAKKKRQYEEQARRQREESQRQWDANQGSYVSDAKLKSALKVLEIDLLELNRMSKADLLRLAKKKRNKFMIQYHPDALRGQGKSEEEIRTATEESKKFNVAVDTIERWAEKVE